MSIMKNINKAKVMVLKDQVSYQEGQIVSKTLVQNESVSITLFAFDKGEEISTTSPAATPSSPASTEPVKSPSTA